MKRPNKQMEPEEVRDFLALAAKAAVPFVDDAEKNRARGAIRGLFGQVLGDEYRVHVTVGWLFGGDEWQPESTTALTFRQLRAILDWMGGVLTGTEWIRSPHFGVELQESANLAVELWSQWIEYLEQD